VKTSLDFIVLAYPRSGTTWLANWLTTDRSLCLHDPFAIGLPEAWPRDHRVRGISCTGSYMVEGFLDQFDCPVAIIERDRAECDRSLAAAGLSGVGISTKALDAIDALRVPFEDLWNPAVARILWAHLLPTVPFDAIRYEMLCDMQVQPHMGKWTADAATMQHLLDAGLVHIERSV
jgi:hypothetical protein